MTPHPSDRVGQERGSPSAEELLRPVPSGALALAGIAVALLLAAWLVVYLFVFLPRGMVS